MQFYPFERPNHPGEFIQLKKIDPSLMFTTLAQIAPPEIYKRIRQTVQGEKEIENPDHPESIAEKQRVATQANEVLVRFYLTQGVSLELTEKMNAEIDEKISEFRAILSDPDWSPDNRKMFYIEKVFVTTLDDLGNLVAAIHQLAFVGREEALAFAKLFRTYPEWCGHMEFISNHD